ncbi:hypothetical protein M2316_003623 [Cellulosimicrobium cellulans]|nr:hypothetical protein [Cellulosimicrobium cellulans]
MPHAGRGVEQSIGESLREDGKRRDLPSTGPAGGCPTRPREPEDSSSFGGARGCLAWRPWRISRRCSAARRHVPRHLDRARHVWLRRGVRLVVIILVVRFLLVPTVPAAERALVVLSHVEPTLLARGVLLEALRLATCSVLTSVVLPREGRPAFSWLFRTDLSALSVAHVTPAGAATSNVVRVGLLHRGGVRVEEAVAARSITRTGFLLLRSTSPGGRPPGGVNDCRDGCDRPWSGWSTCCPSGASWADLQSGDPSTGVWTRLPCGSSWQLSAYGHVLSRSVSPTVSPTSWRVFPSPPAASVWSKPVSSPS